MEQKENMAPSSGLDDDLPPSGPPADSLRHLKKKYPGMSRTPPSNGGRERGFEGHPDERPLPVHDDRRGHPDERPLPVNDDRRRHPDERPLPRTPDERPLPKPARSPDERPLPRPARTPDERLLP